VFGSEYAHGHRAARHVQDTGIGTGIAHRAGLVSNFDALRQEAGKFRVVIAFAKEIEHFFASLGTDQLTGMQPSQNLDHLARGRRAKAETRGPFREYRRGAAAKTL